MEGPEDEAALVAREPVLILFEMPSPFLCWNFA
jgi:hypothetical protein